MSYCPRCNDEARTVSFNDYKLLCQSHLDQLRDEWYDAVYLERKAQAEEAS